MSNGSVPRGARLLVFISCLVGVTDRCGWFPLAEREARAESADALYQRGVALRREGKDTEALEVFRRLVDTDASPRALAQLGLAEQALGIWVEAETHLADAMKGTADSWIKKNHETLAAAMQVVKRRLGSIEIWGVPVGAEVLIDGKVVGRLPLASPVRVVVGDLPISVRAPGYVERNTSVRIGPGQSAREHIALQRSETLPPPVVAAAAQPAPAGIAGEAAHQPIPSAPRVADVPAAPPMVEQSSPDGGAASRSSGLRRSAKWMAWGLGAAALGLGVYGAVHQGSVGRDFDSSCGLDAAGTPRARPDAGKTDQACASLRSSVDSTYRLEVIGLAAGGALVAAGLALWLTEPVGENQTASASLGCAPRLGGGFAMSPGVACAARIRW